jgi:hypothetical protein
MRNVPVEVWVVYLRPIKGSPDGIRAVCEQREWEIMDRARPGYYTLIQAGIVHEGEAERLARGRSGEARVRNAKRSMTSWPGEAVAVAAGPEVAVSG